MICIFDTYAWIEYFFGTDEGKKAGALINREHKIITMECTLAELYSYCIRKGHDFNDILSLIKESSLVFPVLRETWIEAASIKHQEREKRQGFGLIDAILVAKQREHGAKLVTGDPHFRGMKDVVYLPKA